MNYTYFLEFIIAGLTVVILDIISKKYNSKYGGIITSLPFFFLIGLYMYRNNEIEKYLYNCVFSNIIVFSFIIITYFLIINKKINLKFNSCLFISILSWIILNIIFFNYIFK